MILHILRKITLASVLALSGHSALAQPASVLLPKQLPFPESLSATVDGTLYASSITNGGIARALPHAPKATVWINPGAFGTRSTFGVFAETKTGTLWVCSNDATAIGIKGPSTVEGAYIKTFDLATGAGKDSIRLPPGPAICNDFARAPDGAMIVTNTAGAELLRLAPGAKALEVWLKDDRLKGGPDGLAFDSNGNLYVNTYVSGELFRVDVKDGKAALLTKLSPSRPLVHPDGMKPVEGGFLMVEGGGTLDRITIAGDTANVETLAHYAGPTGVSVAGDTVWVSEGKLALIAAAPKDPSQMPSFQLRSSTLPAK
jgi:streptogramin lyase